MRNDSRTGLILDPDFSRLMMPLSDADHQSLEERIRNEGCRSPIVTWDSKIVSGQERYLICIKHGIHFRTREISFSGREEAVSWICTRQLRKPGLMDEMRKYLIGRLFHAEKVLHKDRWKRNLSLPQDILVEGEDVEKTTNLQGWRTDIYLGEKYGLSASEVSKLSRLCQTMDAIGTKAPNLFREILLGNYKISGKNMAVIAQMSEEQIQGIETRLREKAGKELPLSYVATNALIRAPMAENEKVVLRPEIKNMPTFDPDAEINGLSFTIPTWVSMLKRTQIHSDPGLVSLAAKERLQVELHHLEKQIHIILQVMEE